MSIYSVSKTAVLFLFVFCAYVSAEVLDLAKKNVYNLGTGESLALKLDFPKGGQYEFSSVNNAPFALKKISATKIEISFEAAKLSAKPADKQDYQANYSFVKVNTGRKSTLTVRASYAPSAGAAKPAAQPAAQTAAAKPAADPVVQAQKQVQQTAAEMQQTAAKAQQVANSVGIAPATAAGSAPAETIAAEPAVPDTVKILVPAAPQPAPFPWLYLIIIGVLALTVIVLIIKQMVPKHSPATGKYEEFYKDVATILDVNIKGRSIDNCSEEIIHALMDLVQSEENPVALIKGKHGVEKRTIYTKSQSSSKEQDELNTGDAASSMSSQFIDPSYSSAFSSNSKSGSGTLRTRNSQNTLTEKAEELSYENPLDYLGAASTNNVDPDMLNKIHREIKSEENGSEQESIEEKRKKIEEMLGKRKF